jgi:signal transduction histidine kinase
MESRMDMRSIERRSETRERVPSAPMVFVELFAHDARHALSMALGAARTLERSELAADDATVSALRGVVLSNLEELESVLGNVLDLGHIAMVERAEGEAVRLDLIVREAVAATDLGGHELDVELAPMTVWGSHVLLRQAVVNLLRNAIVHTPVGTSVRVCLRPDVSMSERPAVRLEIEDDGPGIPDAYHQRVFDPFERGMSHRASPGLGLGLALVQRIVALHDGETWVEDAPCSGARFVVTLPTAPSAVSDVV